MRSIVALSACIAALCGCAKSTRDLDVFEGTRCVPCGTQGCDDPLEIQFLGAAGFLLRRGPDAILTGPFFSNPRPWRLALWHIAADTDLIDRWLPPVDDVQAILVGHAHYDHLMDALYVAEEHAVDAKIYGNQTAKNTSYSVAPLRERFVVLDDRAWSPGEPKQWVDVNPRVRFVAIESMHAPVALGITMWSGSRPEPLEALPRRASGWRMGQVLSYLIEFRSGAGTVDFRVFYQDTATDAGVGYPPSDLSPIDVAIPCVASFDNVRGYPMELVQATAPRHVVLGHWEDYFRPYTQDPRGLRQVPLTDVRAFIEELDPYVQSGGGFTLPAPGSRILYQRCRERSTGRLLVGTPRSRESAAPAHP